MPPVPEHTIMQLSYQDTAFLAASVYHNDQIVWLLRQG